MRIPSSWIATTALIAVSLVSVTANARTSTDSFVEKASISDRFEIKSSELALKQSKNSDVKSFAQQMIDDHEKSSADLKTALKSSDATVKPASSLDKKHEKLLGELQSLSGDAFDSRYVAIQKDAHKEALDLFRDYSKNGDNAEVKSFASNTLPTLKNHDTHVKQLAKKAE